MTEELVKRMPIRERRAVLWLKCCDNKEAKHALEIIRDLLAENARLKAAMQWQPIETAPKDGTTVFLWTGNAEFPSRHEGEWREPTDSEYWVSGSEDDAADGSFNSEEGWFAECYVPHKLQGEEYPTHWQPLPTPPEKQGEA